MLKHKEILDRLDKLEKAAIVASALDAEPFERAGVPPVHIVPLDGDSENDLSYFSAAHSWNISLLGRFTEELIAQNGAKNNLFVTPDLKTAVDPSAAGLSEDACLNGAIGAEIIRAAHKSGAAIGLKNLNVGNGEIAYIDKKEDHAAVYELFVKPFVKAVENDKSDAVFVDPSREGLGYYDTNRAILSDVQNGLLGDDVFIVAEGENFGADAVNLLKSNMTLRGCTIPLERAIRRYSQLKLFSDEGSVPRREIKESLRNGNAIADEKLDAIVDDIIDFALSLDKLGEASFYEIDNGGDPSESLSQTENENSSDLNAENCPDGEEAGVFEDANKDGGQSAQENHGSFAEGGDDADATSANDTGESVVGQVAKDEGLSNVGIDGVPLSENESATDVAEANNNANSVSDIPESGNTDGVKAESASAFSDAIRLSMVAESLVLLKNEGKLLPLAAGAKVAVLGEAYDDMSAFDGKFKIVGRAKGYDGGATRSDQLIPAAVRATKNADVAVVFLRPDSSDKLALPANRIALLDALKKAKSKVVCVILGDKPIDMSFDGLVDALFLAPEDCLFAPDALASVLCGEINPSGRLTRTYYDCADEYFRKLLADRDAKILRIGAFTGYRRFGIEKTNARYPFGFGLSYSEFRYSGLELSQESVTFTLTNVGKHDGYEVVQVYVGAPRTSRAVPEKQLRAFEKVFLRKGESKKVSITLPISAFETYDPDMYADNVEEGEYQVYVCSSSLDVRLQGKLVMKGVKRNVQKLTIADFSPDAEYADVSEISKEGRVSKKKRAGSRTLGILRKAALYALPTLATLFFFLLSIFILSMTLDYFVLDALEEELVEEIMFISAAGVLIILPLFVGFNRKRLVKLRNVLLLITPLLIVCLVLFGIMFSQGADGKLEEFALKALTYITVGVPVSAVVATFVDRQLWRDKNGKNHWDKYYFERLTGDKVTDDVKFEEAMRAADAAREAKTVKQEDVAPVIVPEAPQFYDKRLTYAQMLGDCKKYVAESGVSVSDVDLADWIAAMSSTQLAFVPAGDGAKLCEAVSGYFGRKPYVDNAENYSRYDDLFTAFNSDGYVNEPTNFASALEKAVKETAYMHTVLIRHIDGNKSEMLFGQLADVLARRKITFSANSKNVALPANIFIVAEVESDKVVLPEKLAEVAAALYPKCSDREPARRRTIVQTVGFERMHTMSRIVRDDFPISEEIWKLVDDLDERCKSGHIGNNIWNRMEMHSSVLVACGEGQEDSIDRAVAAELLPWLSVIWNDDEGDLASVLKDVFGETKLNMCEALLDENGVKDEQIDG